MAVRKSMLIFVAWGFLLEFSTLSFLLVSGLDCGFPRDLELLVSGRKMLWSSDSIYI